MPALSLIVPTCGRPSLAATLASMAAQLEPADELIVVADGVQWLAEQFVYGLAVPAGVEVVYLEATHLASAFGNAQRDVGMSAANGELLLFMDDDDVYAPGALAAVRRAAEAAPGSPVIFRTRWGAGHHASGAELWRDKQVRVGNVATPMVVLPNRRYAVQWMDGNAAGVVSDFAFLSAAIAEAGEPVWDDTVVAVVRPVRR